MKKVILILGLLMFSISSKAQIFTFEVASDFTRLQAAFGHVETGCSAIQDRLQDLRCRQKVAQKFVNVSNCPQYTYKGDRRTISL